MLLTPCRRPWLGSIVEEESIDSQRAPRVFISYAWEDGKRGPYRAWIEQLALALCRDGVDVRLDAWHCAASRDFVSFMNSEVRHADRVLIVGSPGYRERVHAREDGRGQSGAAWEALLVTGEIFRGNFDKLLVAVGRGARDDALPDFLFGRQAFDLGGIDAFAEYQDLLDELLGDRSRRCSHVEPPPMAAKLEPLFGAAPATPTDFEDELASYRTRAVSEHERLRLLGLGVRLRFPIDLEQLHVPLRALVDRRPVGFAGFDDARDAERQLAEALVEQIELRDAFRRVDELGRRGFVLLGDPGSGKSTHVKQILLSLLRGSGAQTLGFAAEPIPVLLVLRELELPTDLERATSDDFDAFVDQAVRKLDANVADGFAKRLRERSPVLYLLDGLDEIAAGDRASLMHWLGRVLRERRRSNDRFVVTCRFAGYDEAAQMLADELLEMHVRPLNKEQIERFAHNWYRLLERSRRPPSDAEAIAEQKARGLAGKLRDPKASRTAALATNPLLLTALCVVFLEHEHGLPARPVELLARCVDVLLKHWIEGKELACTLDAEQAKELLGRAALWMHAEPERVRVVADDLAPVVADALPGGDARSMLKAIRDESGLLTGWSGTHYGFLHLAFQEYLAPAEIVRRAGCGDFEPLHTLAGQLGVSWWREVTMLFAALATPAMIERYLERAVRVPAFGVDTDWLDWIEIEAGDLPVAPLLALIDEPPGKDEAFWRCQLAAVLAAERVAAVEVRGRVGDLRKHLLWELSARYRVELDEVRSRVDARSGVELVRIPEGEGIAAFELARWPVTNEQYACYLRERPDAEVPAYCDDAAFAHPRQPVVGISWNGARAYCEHYGLRLPTDAEWEHACRAGTASEYWSGNEKSDLARVGWFDENSGGRLHPVAERPANPWGLFDVHGNVCEWCEVEWPNGSRSRVSRGGCYFLEARSARSAFRFAHPELRLVVLGFRPARSLS